MSVVRVQCSGCGFLTLASDEPCPRCGVSLAQARVIGDADSGATMFSGETRYADAAPPGPPAPPPGTWTSASAPPPPPRPVPTPRVSSQQPVFVPPAWDAAKPASPKTSRAARTAVGVVVLGLVAVGVLFVAGRFITNTRSAESKRAAYAAILTKQPDFVANVDGYDGNSKLHGRFASLNGSRLIQVAAPKSFFLGTGSSGTTQVTIIFRPDDKVTAVAHEFWIYRTVHKSALGELAGGADPINDIGRIASIKTTTVEELGTEKVGDIDTTILSIAEKGAPPIRVNIAPALQNLIVRIEAPAASTKGKADVKIVFSNVSLTVDPELFRVPTSYQERGTVSDGSGN